MTTTRSGWPTPRALPVVGLPVPGRYRLWAFADLNRNRSFEPTSDLLAPADTTLSLTAESPQVRGLVLTVVNPPRPERSVVLSSGRFRTARARPACSRCRSATARSGLIATVNDRGEVRVSLDPGVWIVRAFRDLDANHGWSRSKEPIGPASQLDVAPAAEINDLKLPLPEMVPGGAPPDSLPIVPARPDSVAPTPAPPDSVPREGQQGGGR